MAATALKGKFHGKFLLKVIDLTKNLLNVPDDEELR